MQYLCRYVNRARGNGLEGATTERGTQTRCTLPWTKRRSPSRRAAEAFLIAKFDGVETSVSIHAADQEQVVTLLNRLVARIEQGALPG